MLLGESGDRTPAPLYPLEILEFNWLEGGETQTKRPSLAAPTRWFLEISACFYVFFLVIFLVGTCN